MTRPSVEDEWAELAGPWTAEAARLGFPLLERRIQSGVPPSPDTTFVCTDFCFDGTTTFLDVSGVLARGRHHRGLLIGLNGVQLYTYVRTPSIVLVLTNGMPPNAVERTWRQQLNPLVWLVSKLAPPKFAPIPMHGPDDLAFVVQRHRQQVAERGGEPIEVTGPPLDFRWRISDEWEKSDTPW